LFLFFSIGWSGSKAKAFPKIASMRASKVRFNDVEFCIMNVGT
jgi:hypothetical protein